MGTVRGFVILAAFILLLIFVASINARSDASRRRQASELADRIDCYPDAESKFATYSKENCLARHCLFDDAAGPGVTQCYLRPNYGYQLQGGQQDTPNGIQLRLKRNQAVESLFAQPIENVLLDVQYYTNDIIRFKLYDADNQRYEVRL